MKDVSLAELENAANEAYVACSDAEDAAKAAEEKTAAAQQAYDDAVNRTMFGDGSPEGFAKVQEAQQALGEAIAAQKAAEESLEAAKTASQEAAEAVEEKKDELRQSRDRDTAYVVHCARVECSCGMRESYLALGPSHGVKTRQIPQMVTCDAVLDTNIINFGGCRSKENPSLVAAAEEAARRANEEIREKIEQKGIFNRIVDAFCGDGQIEVSDSLLEQCVGECRDCFPAGAEWRMGHTKVSINGKPVLLRRCSARCIYGGLVTILLSGQPE